jgi:hypothetical protein
MKSKLSILAASISLIACVSPANADSVVQLWSCELNEGKTRAELMEVSVAWMNAVKAMDGAKSFEGHLEFPIASDNQSSFTFVLIADNAKNWGAFQDAYEGSAAAEADEAWGDVADCSTSSIWNSVKIE